MKKILLTVALVLSALLAVFAAACNTGKQDYTVSLDTQSVSLGAFERYRLTAVVRDEENNEIQQDINWQSADESVAKVTDGVIFATGAGTAEVSATLNNGACAKCTVTVTDSGVIPELRVNAKALSIGKDQKFTVVSKVYFNGSDCTERDTVFTYISAQDSVATVSQDGIITAKAEGNTKITVYALWRGIGGPDKIGESGAIAGLMLTIDVKVIIV